MSKATEEVAGDQAGGEVKVQDEKLKEYKQKQKEEDNCQTYKIRRTTAWF